nr:unnamed protein product [Brassica oleracea]
MSWSVRSGFVLVFCFILLLLASNVGCANARRLGFHKHHHKIQKVASSVQDVVNGGGRKRALGGVETGGEVVVMDYPQPHRKPPIHNEKAHCTSLYTSYDHETVTCICIHHDILELYSLPTSFILASFVL